MYGNVLKTSNRGGGLPDFMTWSGVTKLPAFWKPFQSPVFTIIAVIVVPVIVAIVIGSLTF